MSRLSHSSWFDVPNNIWGWVQNMKLLIVQLPPLSCYFIPLRSKYTHQLFEAKASLNIM
jgi:putative component of membrane protein insertase Oxa1/YidC/SpoIIIJ protein YidD